MSNIDQIESKIEDPSGLLNESVELSDGVGIGDVWKYALISKDLNDVLGEVSSSLQSNIYGIVSSSSDALTLLEDGLKKMSVSDESSDEQEQSAVDYAIGCFFIGVQLSIGQYQDGEWVFVNDEDMLRDWVLGYGNPYGYDSRAGDIISEFLGDNARSSVFDTFIGFLLQYFEIDCDDYLSDDGTDWQGVADAIIANNF